nr:MAG TPA: hypothetical protein [Caudoviricetes sp.]
MSKISVLYGAVYTVFICTSQLHIKLFCSPCQLELLIFYERNGGAI